MTETLAEKKCTPCRGGIPPLTHEEAERFQSQTPNWELRDDAHRIERTFRFRNFQEALGLFEPWVTWLKPKAITPISASAGVTRRSRCAPRRSRDCTRTILSWRASSIGCSTGRKALPIISEVGKLEPWQRERSCCHGFRRNRLSRPPYRSASSSARLLRSGCIKASRPRRRVAWS